MPKPRTAFIQRPTLSGSGSAYTYPDQRMQFLTGEFPSDYRTPSRPRSQEHVKWDSERPSSASSTASSSSESHEPNQQADGDQSGKKSYKSSLADFKRRKAATKARHEGAPSRSADNTPSPLSPASKRSVTQPVSQSLVSQLPVFQSPELPPKTYKKESSARGGSQIKRPPNKPKPAFYSDTILESEEVETNVQPREVGMADVHVDEVKISIRQQQMPQHAASPSPPQELLQEAQGTYCPQCHNKLRLGETVCTYCQHNVSVNGKNWQQQQQPLRASITTENVHETQYDQDKRQKLRQLLEQTNSQSVTPPPRPSKPTPGKPLRASAEDATQATEQHQFRMTEFQHKAASYAVPFQPSFQSTQQKQQQQYRGGAPGGDYGRVSGVPSESGIELLRQKEVAFKQSQRKDGVREEDLERLPELVEAERYYNQAQKDKAKQKAIQEGKYVEDQQDPKKYERIDFMSVPQEDESDPREQKKMDMLKNKGLELLNWIEVLKLVICISACVLGNQKNFHMLCVLFTVMVMLIVGIFVGGVHDYRRKSTCSFA